MAETKRAERTGERSVAPNLVVTTRHCSEGEWCVSYAAQRVPAKLSWGNPGPRCFACEEHHAAIALTQAKTLTGRACAKGACGRPAVERQHGVRVCGEHAEAGRARERQEVCSRLARSCEDNLRNALSAGDKELARKWSRELEKAKTRLALTESNLAAAEARAHSEPTDSRLAM